MGRPLRVVGRATWNEEEVAQEAKYFPVSNVSFPNQSKSIEIQWEDEGGTCPIEPHKKLY
jgi:hypothetical protein